jgi:uncharacterized protein (TIGR03437 family)
MNEAGLADSGTRFKVVISDIPNNIHLWISGRDVIPGAASLPDTAPRALLTYSDDNAGGPFQRNFPANNGYALVYPENGTLTAVWEVVAADPDVVEELTFSIRILAPNGLPPLGLASVHGSIGPVFPGTPVRDRTTTVAPMPSFAANLEDPVPAFRIVSALQQNELTIVSAASYAVNGVAPDSAVAAFAPGLSPTTEVSGLAPAPTLAGVNVDVIDYTGTRRPAPLFLVSPGQVNFLIDGATHPGQAVFNVRHGGSTIATGYALVKAVAPALFTANGSGRGIATGEAIYQGSSTATTRSLARFDVGQGSWVAEAVDLTSADSMVFLALYGTGIRGRSSLAGVSVTIGGVSIPVQAADALPGAPGIDQVRAGPIPRSLAGRGNVPVILTVDGSTANTVEVLLR